MCFVCRSECCWASCCGRRWLSADRPGVTRRLFLTLSTAAVAVPVLAPFAALGVDPAARRDLRFRALRGGASIGEHRVTFRSDGDRLTVATRVDIAVKVLFITAFRFKHDAEEVWQADRLVSVKSTTNDNGTLLQVTG